MCMYPRWSCCLALCASTWIALAAATAWAGATPQEPPASPAREEAGEAKPEAAGEGGALEERFAKFTKQMSGVKLVGRFTVVGRDNGNTKEEEYEIKSVAKLPEGDYWTLNARIKYGKLDVTLPLRLEIKWAGETPMISMTDWTIPGLGTFSCRVLFDNGKYAGTWTHGEVGGHMFGKIVPLEEASAADDDKEEQER